MYNLWSSNFFKKRFTGLFQVFVSVTCLLFFVKDVIAQNASIWSTDTYPDEAGYLQRTAGLLQQIANDGFGKRSLAKSKCPDTGLPVYTWALEGETIISPYTGTSYKQGNTGYFGPKKRNIDGEITMFGGDPLKYDLPPATASLLLGKDAEKATAFLSIPGNLSQHYHFASVNWARFYPLFADKMGEKWIKDFSYAVDQYRENRRPSDGYRQYISDLSVYHTLLGEKGEFLGGNVKDGGTENHKMMWRSSALLYSDLLPDTAKITGVPLQAAKEQLLSTLGESGSRIWKLGNGEYDSGTYYPHTFNGLFNLYDFAKDARSKRIAKTYLDYYLGTYALKVFQGVIAGAQKRAKLPTSTMGEMGHILWSWTGSAAGLVNEHPHTTIQHATTTYRPNQVIYNLLTKNVPLPFEAEIARPDYHVRFPNKFQEYFYCDEDFALGNVAMTTVDNPTQQLQWSLVVGGKDRPYVFGGVQPFYASRIGHSPYTQTLQKENSLLVITAPTAKNISNPENEEQKSRKEKGKELLLPAIISENSSSKEIAAYLKNSKYSAATWLFIPKEAFVQKRNDSHFFISCGDAYLSVISVGNAFMLEIGEEVLSLLDNRRLKARFSHSNILLCKQSKNDFESSGFAIEVFNKDDFEDLTQLQDNFKGELSQNFSQFTYKAHKANTIEIEYQSTGLRAKGKINNKRIDYSKWADGGVYKSPYVQLKNGLLQINDGKAGYTVEWKDNLPVYRPMKIK